MSSMKLFKPTYSYGAHQKSFSEYEHQESKNQSNYANYNWENSSNQSRYDSSSRELLLGQSVDDFDAYESSHARANKSTNHYAHAQRALPSPSIHVQQGHHSMQKMKRQESSMGQDWTNNSPKCSSPTSGEHSSLTMHNKNNHMMGEMENGWANKPNKYSSSGQAYNMGQSKYNERGQKAYNYDEAGLEGGYASKPTLLTSPKYISPVKTHQPGLITQNEDHGWASSNSKFSSPAQVQTQHSGLAMHEEDHMMGKPNIGWANSPTKFSGPTQTHQSSLAKGPMMEKHYQADMSMHNEGQMMGKTDQGWASARSKFLSPAQTHHGMHREDHMVANKSSGWANSPAKYSGPNREHEQHGWATKSNNGFGPNQLGHSAHKSYDDDYDQCVDEDVYEIMDEILTKYPAHNVSGGHGSNWAANNTYASQNQVAGYGKQQGYSGSAHYGSAAQSMASSNSKFAVKKEMNASHSSSFKKEEYSASSSANKFEANSMMNRGGYC